MHNVSLIWLICKGKGNQSAALKTMEVLFTQKGFKSHSVQL